MGPYTVLENLLQYRQGPSCSGVVFVAIQRLRKLLPRLLPLTHECKVETTQEGRLILCFCEPDSGTTVRRKPGIYSIEGVTRLHQSLPLIAAQQQESEQQVRGRI